MNVIQFLATLVLALIAIGLYHLYWLDQVKLTDVPIKDDHPRFRNLEKSFTAIKKKFDRQTNHFWPTIRKNLEEVEVYQQPRTIIFLYKPNARKTIDSILRKVSQAALCFLSDCSNIHISIDEASLTDDYTNMLDKYKDGLERNNVLIVKHLNKFSGRSAQAFRHFTDVNEALVKRAFILFTVEVDSLPPSLPRKFVGEVLKTAWSDLDESGKFEALFQRLSSTVLSVIGE